jgi:hypothetical protein
MTRLNKLFIIFPLAAFITGCSGGEVKRSLGLSKDAPDEFMVVSRPPLSVPPDFRLQPPTDLKSTSTSKVRDEAKQVLFPTKQLTSKGGKTRGEMALLKNAKTEEANPKIREILAKEQLRSEVEEEEKSMLDSIRDALNPEDDAVVDVSEEEKRLQKNIEEGKPVNEGEVAEKDTKSKGILNKWFGN